LPRWKYGTPCQYGTPWSTSHLRRHCRPQNGDWKLNFLSAATHPSAPKNYRVMVLRFTVLLRDLEAFLRYVSIVAFCFYLLTYYINTFSWRNRQKTVRRKTLQSCPTKRRVGRTVRDNITTNTSVLGLTMLAKTVQSLSPESVKLRNSDFD